MAAQWPLVLTQLLQVLPTLPNWGPVKVFDGAAVDSAPQMYATVGHSTDGQTTASGSFTTQQHHDGVQTLEVGSVACQLFTSDATIAISDDRTAIFTCFNAIEEWVRANRTLGGVLSPEGTSGLTVDVAPSQTVPGSNLSLAFFVNYTTVT